MPKYVVVDVTEKGAPVQTYGPFPGRRSAEEWRLKTMEQLAGVVGKYGEANKVARANSKLKVVPLESRGDVRSELAVLERSRRH
jgi:hypothetical protein